MSGNLLRYPNMGARLGRYVVLKHLATGGMADVLLGRTEGIEGFERHVVLKRIRPEHARDQRFIRMFLDEARVAANLHHQHIVQVHDVGESAGEYFIAMEYLHGEDVRTILSNASKTRAHVPLGYAIAIVSSAAAGLHYAHERRGHDKRPLGIVHRDVSPSNILVGYDGSIKVVDFGIAKASMRPETRSGSLKGKVSYMSPEQCRSDDIDRRSDVYSLGVVLYELCTTTRLFKGENDYLVMDQIVNGRVSLPQVRRPDLPNELSAIIMRAIAPDPERRYFTADELRVALEQFATRAGLTAAPSAIATYMRKQFGDKPEPWLELGSQIVGSLDDVPVLPQSRAPSWTELPRIDEIRRSGGFPRTVTPIPLAQEAAPDVVHEGSQRMSSARMHATPPTDSKMGWESQQLARASRGFTPAKVAMFVAPLVVLLAFAIWRFAGTGSTGALAVAARPSPQSSQPAPVVTPIPVPPPAPAPAPVEPPSPAPTTKVAARTPEPAQPAKHTPPPPPPPKKPSTSKVVETGAASSSKSEPAAPPAPAPASPPSAPASGTASGPATPPASGPAPGPAPAPASATTTPATSAPPAPPAAPVTPPAAPAPAPVPGVDVPAVLSQALINSQVASHRKEFSKCEGGENLHGDIVVSFLVDHNGKVTNVQASKFTKLTGCFIKVVSSWQFPKPGPAGAKGSYTFSFQ